MSERQVVVIRTGPDKKKGRLRDGIIGFLGVALLVGSVMLVDILPEEEPVIPQYKASFLTGTEEFKTQRTDAPLSQGQTISFPVEVTAPNVNNVLVTFTFEDDMPATNADLFLVELESPNGTLYPYKDGQLFSTADRMRVPGATSPPYYQTSEAPNGGVPQATAIFNLRGVPADFFFTTEDVFGEPIDAELFEIEAKLEDIYYDASTIGTWQIHVTLVRVGHCPDTNPSTPEYTRGVECNADHLWTTQGQSGDATGTDTGNHVVMANASFSYYVPAKPELVQ